MPRKKETLLKLSDDKLKEISDKMENRFVQKQKEGVTLKEVILKLKGYIRKALKRGYTYDEIAGFLQEEGIEVKGATIKQYLAGTNSSLKKSHSQQQNVTEIEKSEAPSSVDKKSDSVKQESRQSSQQKSASTSKFVEVPDKL